MTASALAQVGPPTSQRTCSANRQLVLKEGAVVLVSAAVQVSDLEVAGARAFAHSGSVDWLDPIIGARVRYTVAPGHKL